MTALYFLEFITDILYVILHIDIFAYETSVWLFSVPITEMLYNLDGV